MTASLFVDGVLVQWGDRLFYPGNRMVRSPSGAISGRGLQQRAADIRRRLHATVVRGAPQVMVKVTGGGRGMAGIRAHLRYISKNGRLPMEDDRGVERDGKERMQALVDQWRRAGSLIPEHSHRREAFNVMLSMPAGTPALTLKVAAREFARTEFANHRYVLVLHTHQANPHVHLSVRAEGKDGQRLNPRKADLRRWRETFAERLREQGIDAEASPQTTRGGHRRTERLWRRKARDDGRVAGPREGELAPLKMTPSRRSAAMAWCEIAKALASSESIEDRSLAQSIVDYARWLPGVRYKPPEREAQKELPGLERNGNAQRDMVRDAPPSRPAPRRDGAEWDRGR
jgi:hypothetical protein